MGSLPTPEAVAGKEGGGSGEPPALAADGGGGGRVGAEAMRRLFEAQRRHIEHFFDHLRHEEAAALAQALAEAEGSVFFSGVGKSGFVARKIAHTLSSVGFPRAAFLHPVDALHGDLGAVGRGDVVVVLSKSGASEELLRLVPCARAKGARIAAVTSVAGSALARAADLSVHLPLERELCPFDLAPVTSAAVQMLFGDTIAVALMEASGLTLEKYASNHPAGRIGKSLIFKVKDVMKKQPELPLCKEGDLIVEQLVELTSKGCGCLLVVDENNSLIGTFTDGDLRRALKANGEAIFKLTVGGVCNRKPRTIAADAMAVDAMRKMEAPPSPVQFLPVVDSKGHVIGIVTLHGLVSAGL